MTMVPLNYGLDYQIMQMSSIGDFPADSTTEGPSLGAEKPDFTTDPFIVGTTPTDGFPFNLKIKQGTVVNAQ